MRIGELARRSGVPAKTIRYYESRELLSPPARSAAGYRLYDDASLDRLRFVRKAQQLGLSLAEVREIAQLRDGGSEPCAHVVRLLDAQIERVDRARTQLDGFARQLRDLRASASQRSNARAAVCRIIEHATLGDRRELAPLLRGRRTR